MSSVTSEHKTLKLERLAMPVVTSGWSLSRRAQAGENVAALLEHPGFADLCAVLSLRDEGIQNAVMLRQPAPDAANYADAIGHQRGLREVELIARGVVENGKTAADEQRRIEQEGN